MSQHPILLVEDDENDILFFKRAMDQASVTYPLRIARDGREAIGYFSGTEGFEDRSQYPLPCLVLLDLNLPHKNGLEVLQWIRRSAPDPVVPVIVLTSSMADLDMRDAYRFGANSYLVKPSQPEDLVEVVRVLKLYWFDFNRVPTPFGKR
jgi:CheY-like chemotaxis protein